MSEGGELLPKPDQSVKKTGLPAVIKSASRWVERKIFRREVLDDELVTAAINKVYTDAMNYGFQINRQKEATMLYGHNTDPVQTGHHISQLCNVLIYTCQNKPLLAGIVVYEIANRSDNPIPEDPKLRRAATLDLSHISTGLPLPEGPITYPLIAGNVSHRRIKDTEQSKFRIVQEHFFTKHQKNHTDDMSITEIEDFLKEFLESPVDIESTKQSYEYLEKEENPEGTTTVRWNSEIDRNAKSLPIASEA